MRIDASHEADLRDDVAWHELILDAQAEAAIDGVLTVNDVHHSTAGWASNVKHATAPM
jgi:hypothetical protein